jgi:hypothetical protein
LIQSSKVACVLTNRIKKIHEVTIIDYFNMGGDGVFGPDIILVELPPHEKE